LQIFVIPSGEVAIASNTSKTTTTSAANVKESNNTTYEDDNIKITIKTLRENDTNIYVADVTISNIDYLKTAFANNTYGRNIKETTSSMAENNNAILAINGDYYGFRNYGFVLRNGVVYRSTSNENEDLVINSDGSFSIVDEDNTDLESLLNNGALQVFSFGPALINNSKITVDENSEVEQSMTSNPRTAIGIIDNLHYVFVVSDGRTSKSTGLTLYELANIMKDLGCTTAYNLDGGGSSTMYFNGTIVNNPTDGHSSGERKVSDIIYVGY
jgi:exopolysaccharide biosynthesis protein